jgi:hypothetical protein
MINLFLNGLASLPPPAEAVGAAIVPNHKGDKSFTLSTSTDTLAANYATGELCAFKHNIEPSVMWGAFHDLTDDVSAKDTGRLDFADYFQYFRWADPNAAPGATGSAKYKEIPDFTSTTWTSAGAAYFPVTVGAAKTKFYPNHGQELYDVSNGQYGYDYVNGVMGASNMAETNELVNYEKESFFSRFGYYPSVFAFSAYAYPQRAANSKPWRTRFLYGRWTTHAGITADAYTNYSTSNTLGDSRGKGGADFYDMDLSHRWENYTAAEVQTYMGAQLPKTRANKGWFHTFGHWHGEAKADIDAAFSLHYASDAACISLRKAVEHWIFRENYKLETRISGNKVTIDVILDKAYEVPHTLLTADVSIKLDFSGTTLAGFDFTCSTASLLVKKSANVILMEHPMVNPNGFTITLQKGAANYDSTALPTITSATANGTTVTITTSLPTKLALFVVDRNGSYLDATLLTRSNSRQASHTVTIPTADQQRDVYIGAITKAGQSVLSNPIQLL